MTYLSVLNEMCVVLYFKNLRAASSQSDIDVSTLPGLEALSNPGLW